MGVISVVFFFIILAALSIGLWRKTANNKLLKLIFWPALAFRLFSGLLLGYLYSKQFISGRDSWHYQKAGNLLTAVGKSDFKAYLEILLFNKTADLELLKAIAYPTYTNSFFLVKIVSLLNYLTSNNYYFNSLFLSFFSFAGCWYLVQKLGKAFPGALPAAVIALLFFPSIVFWNSGILKDGILLGALCFFWGSALHLAYFSNESKLIAFAILLLSAVLLWKIKFFIAAFVFAITGSWFALQWLYKRFRFFRSGYLRWLAIPLIIVLIAFGFSLLHYKFNLEFLLMSLVLNNEHIQVKSIGKPMIGLENLAPTLSSVLLHTPEALAGILFRPFFWEGDSVFYRLAGFENLVLLGLFLAALASWRKFDLKRIPGFYLMLSVFCICLAVAFGLSTPNLGSLSRYRTAFLPFLIFLLLETPFWRKLHYRLASKFRRLIA